MSEMKSLSIQLIENLPGFEGEDQFELIPSPDLAFPFHTLQSKKTEELSFVVTDPFLFVENYEFELSDQIGEKLKLEKESSLSQMLVLCIVRIPEDVKSCTMNIMAPLVINTEKGLGRQVILEEYSETRYPLFQKEA